MLLIIHNLPANTRTSDIKALIDSQCNLKEIIIGNLVDEGNTKKATVGVVDDSDANLLYSNLNGMYVGGLQLYIEDMQQKKKTEKSHPQADPKVQTYPYNQMNQGQYNYQENTSAQFQYQPNYRVDYLTYQNNMAAMNQVTAMSTYTPYETSFPALPPPLMPATATSATTNKTYPDYGTPRQQAGASQTQQYTNPIRQGNYNNYNRNVDNRSFDRDNRRPNDDKKRPLPWAQTDRGKTNDYQSHTTLPHTDRNKNNDNQRHTRWDGKAQSSQESRYNRSTNYEKHPEDVFRSDDNRSNRSKRPYDNNEMSQTPAKYSRTSAPDNSHNQSLSKDESRYSNYFRKMAEMSRDRPTTKSEIRKERFVKSESYKSSSRGITYRQIDQPHDAKIKSLNFKFEKPAPVSAPVSKDQEIINKDNTFRVQVTANLATELLKSRGIIIKDKKEVGFTKLKTTIRSRLDALLGNKYGMKQVDMMALYKNKFPSHADDKLFNVFMEAGNEKGVERHPTELTPTSSQKNVTTPSQKKLGPKSINPKKGPSKPQPTAFLKPDKLTTRDRKLQSKREFFGEECFYDLPPTTETVLNEELNKLSTLFISHCDGKGEEIEVTKKIKKNCLIPFNNIMRLHVVKRLLNITKNLSIRIFTRGAKIKREPLAMILMKYGVIGLKKSERGPLYYIANCDSYESFDNLLTMNDLVLNNGQTILSTKPLHMTMPRKYIIKQQKMLRNNKAAKSNDKDGSQELKIYKDVTGDKREEIDLTKDENETDGAVKSENPETLEKSALNDDVILITDVNLKEIIDVDAMKSSEADDDDVIITGTVGDLIAANQTEQSIVNATVISDASEITKHSNVSDKNITINNISDENVPDKNVTDKIVPDKNVTDKNVTDKNVPDKNVPNKNNPDNNVPVENVSSVNVPDENAQDENIDENIPEEDTIDEDVDNFELNEDDLEDY
ncbi:uncharacterized protein ACR2FA_001167 isoform 2-T2 [Aphomia sociella]